MGGDTGTKTWLKNELVNVLGFSEVDDILTHIITSFHSKQELEPYLTELLGISTSRTKSISNRLFPTKSQATITNQAKPLVPKPIEANSRIKQLKSKPKSTLLHSRIINCLKCGKIELNGARKCSFCDTELRYEAFDDEVYTHVQNSANIADTEQSLYDEMEYEDVEFRHQRPITLNLDLENRVFTEAPSPTLKANEELSKDARTAFQNIQKKLNKQNKCR